VPKTHRVLQASLREIPDLPDYRRDALLMTNLVELRRIELLTS
jgi:hypothetical protein